MGKTCFFIGHRDAEDSLLPQLTSLVERHITEYNVTEFVVGRHGNFDSLAARAVITAKKQHPHVRLVYLRPYHPAERKEKTPVGFDDSFYPPGMEQVPKKVAITRANHYMVEHSDYLIAYAWHPASNAWNLLEYARKRERKGLICVTTLDRINTDESTLAKLKRLFEISPKDLKPEVQAALRSGDAELDEFVSHGLTVSRVNAKSEGAAKALNIFPGQQITIQTGPLNLCDDLENRCACLTEQLRPMLEPFFGKTLCICGIGNADLPADSLGPETARWITPGLCGILPVQANFSKVTVVCPGTKEQTNIDTSVMVSTIAAATGAACVLTIDASVCSSYKNLCSCVEISSGGMITHNSREKLQQSSIGVPVIAVVVPTVIHAKDLLLMGSIGDDAQLTFSKVAAVVKNAAFLIACSIFQITFPTIGYDESKSIMQKTFL